QRVDVDAFARTGVHLAQLVIDARLRGAEGGSQHDERGGKEKRVFALGLRRLHGFPNDSHLSVHDCTIAVREWYLCPWFFTFLRRACVWLLCKSCFRAKMPD